MSKILRLQATNYKRIKAVEITPDPEGNLVVVTGRNAQGKSSVLDAITAALAGPNKRTTPKPIRDGEDYAEVVLETEDLIVERRFTRSSSTVTVTTRDGAKFPRAQAKLNDLIGKLSLDPLAFTQLSEKDQRETLLGLIELPYDPVVMEQNRKDLYDRRTELGREAKAMGATETVDPALPKKEQSAAELLDRIQAGRMTNQAIENAQSRCLFLQERIRELEQELAKARTSLAAEQETAAAEPVEVERLVAELNTIEETNAAIRANNQAAEHNALRDELAVRYDKLTEAIETLDQQKEEGLRQATLPVPGLGFDENGVTYEGIPFKQTNSAAQIRVSLAMAMALNPKLRVIRIAEGSLLDDDNLQVIADMAAERDYQIWIETVGNGDSGGIVIEDGEVKE